MIDCTISLILQSDVALAAQQLLPEVGQSAVNYSGQDYRSESMG
jgi:hypothetical protein